MTKSEIIKQIAQREGHTFIDVALISADRLIEQYAALEAGAPEAEQLIAKYAELQDLSLEAAHVELSERATEYAALCPFTDVQRDWIKAVLSNDASSTDEELVDYFVDNGLLLMQAVYAVSRRSAFLGQVDTPEL